MNVEQLKKLVKKIENLSYHKFLGLEITKYNVGNCETELTISEDILNPFGTVHGGIYYTVCDVTAFVAACTLLPDNSLAVTSDINISILSTARIGILKVKANVLKAGKRTCFIEAKVMDKNQNLIAISRITKTLIDFPSVSE